MLKKNSVDFNIYLNHLNRIYSVPNYGNRVSGKQVKKNQSISGVSLCKM